MPILLECEMVSFPNGLKRPEPLADALPLTNLPLVQGTEVFVSVDGSIDLPTVHSYLHFSGWRAARILLVEVGQSPLENIAIDERIQAAEACGDVFLLTVLFGKKDETDLPLTLTHCKKLELDLSTATFIVDERYTTTIAGTLSLKSWLRSCFQGAFRTTSNRLHLPPGQVFFIHHP